MDISLASYLQFELEKYVGPVPTYSAAVHCCATVTPFLITTFYLLNRKLTTPRVLLPWGTFTSILVFLRTRGRTDRQTDGRTDGQGP